MSTDRDTTRVVRSWLEDGATLLPDRVLDAVLDQLPTTPQRRLFGRSRRSLHMNNPLRYAIAAAAVLAVALVGYQLLPSNTGSGSGARSTPIPSAQASPSMSASQQPTQRPGTQSVRPFSEPDGLGRCPSDDVDPACVEDPRDDSITFAFDAPASWDLFEIGPWIDDNSPPDGAAVFFYRGNWLFSDPCHPGDQPSPDISVGPTVDDFVAALVDHPALDVSAPVDVTLAGYSGKYLDLIVPDDISECDTYQPIDAHIHAQGPSHRWHMWVLDVDGVRVVVETNDYPDTDAQRLSEIQAIVDSLEITP